MRLGEQLAFSELQVVCATSGVGDALLGRILDASLRLDSTELKICFLDLGVRLYFLRSVVILVFILSPLSVFSVYVFAACM